MRAAGLLTLLFFTAFPLVASGQAESCLNAGRLDELRTQILKGTGASEANTPLRDEIQKSALTINELFRRPRAEDKDAENAKAGLNEAQMTASKRICAILNTEGWPTRAAIAEEGMNAFLYLIGRTLTIRMQLELYPLVAASYEKGEIAGSEALAAYVDRLRVALGRKQLYGTQVSIKDGFLVQAPIELATDVDKRREKMKLVPLRQYERALEIANRLPLIRAVTEPVGNFASRRASAGSAADDSLGLEGEEQAIKIETAFVSVDVNIPDGTDGTSAALEKSDFKLLDNGKPVEIETFAKAETPFDIVLLLDLSGSTSDKVGLIKKTTKRFVEMKRTSDRLAVIVFNDRQTVVSELESDQTVLLERIKKISGNGGSFIWDAVSSGLTMLDEKSEKGRRKAIVLMTDGVDNLLGFYATQSNRAGFADLVEQIQSSNVTIFPIYLDTQHGRGAKHVHESARNTLAYMADQSGGNVYTAKKLDDLEGIYDRVLKGVGTVYTLGFSPEGESTGRSWRTIKVEVPSRPALRLRHRPGYFTR